MRKIIIAIILCGFGFISKGQINPKKIKYKDLFPLLDQKDYNASENLLRLYLSVDKNRDEANPNYQMGLIYMDYFERGDELNDTSYVFSMADSAVYYLDKAKNLIDDKELRKNDEYYQSFYRRDLRTGEFGIKLSDVHLDIEKLIESIRTREGKITKLHGIFMKLRETEATMVESFNELVSNNENLNQFVMSADLPQISRLGELSDYQFNLDQNAKEVSSIATELELEGNYESIEYRSIVDFKKIEPIMSPLDGSLESWNVDAWVENTKRIINGDVAEIKRRLESMDEELTEAKENLVNHEMGVFPASIEADLIDKIERFGNYNTPLTLIQARINENIILSLSDTILNPAINDTTLITYQLEVSDSLLSLAGQLSNITENKSAEILKSEKYYAGFYRNRYENVENAAAYLSELNQFAKDQQIKWDTVQSFWDFKNNWGILESDTIPLFEVDSSRYNGAYSVINIYPVGEYELVAIGIDKEKNKGFAARFGSDRIAKWELNFESKLLEEMSRKQFESDTIAAGPNDLAFYWFSPDSTMENNITIISIGLSGELNWSTSLSVKKKPIYTTYSEAIRQHTLFLYPQEVYPLPGDDLGYIVIDRNGEAR